MGEQFNGLAYSTGLVNAALLTDGQVHRQVQKGIALPLGVGVDLSQGRLHISELCVVLRVLGDPLAGQGFYSFHGRIAQGFFVGGAKKPTYVFLGGAEHAPRLPWAFKALRAAQYENF